MPTAAAERNWSEGAARARASHKRRKALRDIVSGSIPMPDTVSPDMARSAAREASRSALQLARACFDDILGQNAEALAGKLVELAMDGNTAALLTVARSIVPPARFDSTRVALDVGPLETPDDIDRARRRLAEAVFNGQVGVEDAGHLTKLLDSLSEQQARDQRTSLIADMRDALAASRAGGMSMTISSLTARAELLLQGLGAAPAPLIDMRGSDEGDADEWRALL